MEYVNVICGSVILCFKHPIYPTLAIDTLHLDVTASWKVHFCRDSLSQSASAAQISSLPSCCIFATWE